MATIFATRAREIIQSIPEGKVTTYGIIARLAGSPRGARQVAWLLHSSSERYELPWHRVVNREGRISLPKGNGYETQKSLLEKEGVTFNDQGRISFEHFLWIPQKQYHSTPLRLKTTS